MPKMLVTFTATIVAPVTVSTKKAKEAGQSVEERAIALVDEAMFSNLERTFYPLRWGIEVDAVGKFQIDSYSISEATVEEGELEQE